jgi:NTE family protein
LGADFTARKRAIQAGREAALAQLAVLRERIAAKTRRGGARPRRTPLT